MAVATTAEGTAAAVVVAAEGAVAACLSKFCVNAEFTISRGNYASCQENYVTRRKGSFSISGMSRCTMT